MMLAMPEGKHVTHKGVRICKAKAFRLEPAPRTNKRPGLLVVDGEPVPFGPIEARPHPRALRVLMLP